MIHGGVEWADVPEYTIQKSWQHPSAPGMIVTRVFKVYAPTDKAANIAAHLHFLMALNGMGIRFQERAPKPPPDPDW